MVVAPCDMFMSLVPSSQTCNVSRSKLAPEDFPVSHLPRSTAFRELLKAARIVLCRFPDGLLGDRFIHGSGLLNVNFAVRMTDIYRCFMLLRRMADGWTVAGSSFEARLVPDRPIARRCEHSHCVIMLQYGLSEYSEMGQLDILVSSGC